MTDDSKLRPEAPSCLGEYKAWSVECAACAWRGACIDEQERMNAA